MLIFGVFPFSPTAKYFCDGCTCKLKYIINASIHIFCCKK